MSASGFKYDRGVDREDRKRRKRGKHESAESEPYFEFDAQGHEWVGYCPRGLDDSVVQMELDGAIAEPALEVLDPEELPDAFYAVIDGVPYTTRWTNREARTVHGFPWMFREPGGMPRRVLRLLEVRAEGQGRLDRFREWMKTYGKKPLERPRTR